MKVLPLDGTFCVRAFQYAKQIQEPEKCVWLQWSWRCSSYWQDIPTTRLGVHCFKKMDGQEGLSPCVQEAHCLLTGAWFPEDGYTFAPFLKSALLKTPQAVHPKTETRKTVAPFPERVELLSGICMGPFSKAVLCWVTDWLKKQQASVCCSLKLGIAPVTLPLVFLKGNMSILYYGLRKRSFVPNTTFLRFVYSCTSLAYDAVKSRRFSLCLVQGKMSCFSQFREAKCNE